jgi:putative solute:sodium symporter small subunit
LKYWRFNLGLIALLLLLWVMVTFIPAYFARELNVFYVFSWPLPFWMAAFGAPLSFLALIGFYSWRMERRDQVWRQAHHQRVDADQARD